jgi:hypothetical protein
MNPLKQAIKGRRIQIALELSPEGEVISVEPVEAMESEGHEEAKVMKKGSIMDDEINELEDEGSPAQEGKAKLSDKDLMRVKQILASGKEPASITDKMLLEQYQKE